MGFKFLKGEETTNIFTITPTIFQPNDVEFCFQFDDEEPKVFGEGPNDLHIHVSTTQYGNIVFTNNDGRRFKIFAREKE